MKDVEEMIDLLSDDPIRRYRDTIENIIIDNRKKIIKCSKKLRYNISEKDKRAIIRIRRKSTDKIVEYAKFLDPKDREKFWDSLLGDVQDLSSPVCSWRAKSLQNF